MWPASWQAHASPPTAIFGYGIGIDDKHPDNYSVNLAQAGLGLPDRDYYLADDKDMVKTREAYSKYLADMLTLAGLDDAAARADRVYGAGDRDRQGAMDPRRPPRRRQDLQSHDGGGR